MKKKMILAVGLLLAAALLIPIPMHLKDGGTVVYQAVLYQVQDVHRLAPPEAGKEFLEGTVVKILGLEVFNSVG